MGNESNLKTNRYESSLFMTIKHVSREAKRSHIGAEANGTTPRWRHRIHRTTDCGHSLAMLLLTRVGPCRIHRRCAEYIKQLDVLF